MKREENPYRRMFVSLGLCILVIFGIFFGLSFVWYITRSHPSDLRESLPHQMIYSPYIERESMIGNDMKSNVTTVSIDVPIKETNDRFFEWEDTNTQHLNWITNDQRALDSSRLDHTLYHPKYTGQ